MDNVNVTERLGFVWSERKDEKEALEKGKRTNGPLRLSFMNGIRVFARTETVYINKEASKRVDVIRRER